MSHRRVLKIAPALALFTAAASVARGQLVYEPFSYTPGSSLDAKVNPGNGKPWSGMSGDSGDDDILINGSNLTYPGLAASAGNSVTFGGTGKSERLALGPVISSGTEYYSLLLQVNSAGGMTAAPVFIAGFSNRSGSSDLQPTTVGTRLYLRQSSNDGFFNVGVSKNSSSANDIAFDAADYSYNSALLIVGSYEINPAGGTDDVARLYVNPGSLGSTVAPAPNVTAPQAGTDLFNAGAPSLAAFVLRQAVASVPNVQVDELRIGSSWAQVTPPDQPPPADVAWNVDGDGDWFTDQNWSTLAAPNEPSASVVFPQVISQPRTITITSPAALRTMHFTSGVGYLITGSRGTLQLSGGAVIDVSAGSHVIDAPIELAGSLLVDTSAGGVLTLTRDLVAPGSAFSKSGAGTLELRRVEVDQVAVTGGLLRVAEGTPAGASRTRVISVGAGQLDLTDNALAVAAGGTGIGSWTGSAYTEVTGLIALGRNGGNWNGSGIVTSQPEATGMHLTSIGVATAAQALKMNPADTALWNALTVTGGDTLVMYTYGGDANLDGKLNIDDYTSVDQGIKAGMSGWFNGDFNYDGKIDIDDYTIIDSNIGMQGPPLETASLTGNVTVAVPEPMLLAPGVLILGFRRRRAPR